MLLNRKCSEAVLLLTLFTCVPSSAFACGMSAIGAAADVVLQGLFAVAVVVFLAGYLPYLVFSVWLSINKKSGSESPQWMRFIGMMFAGLNTLVFFSAVYLVATTSTMLVFLGDLLLWGLPFGLFVYGWPRLRVMQPAQAADA